MFRAAPMMRLNAVVLNSDERMLLRELGLMGVMELTTTKAGPETAPLEPRDCAQELELRANHLNRIEQLRRALDITTQPSEPAQAQMDLTAIEGTLRSMEERSSGIIKRRQTLQQRGSELRSLREQLSSYRGLEIPLDRLNHSAFLHFVTGSMPVQELEHFQTSDVVVVVPLATVRDRVPIIAISSRQAQPALERTLQTSDFHNEPLPVMEGKTVDELFDANHHEEEQSMTELLKLKSELKSLAAEFAQPLAGIEQQTRTEQRLLEAERHFPRTETAVLVSGWIPAADSEEVLRRINTITNRRCVIELADPEGMPEEEIPVLLCQPRILRPFAMLVATYGLPRYRELEPTLFVAVSYTLMFGMMFGDAGQGGVLALGGLFFLLASRSRGMRDAGLLLLLGGLSSTAFGIIYGSYFGITQLKQYALWRDPLSSNPADLMYSAVGIGIAMISSGLILNINNSFRRHDLKAAFLDRFGIAGLLFYWGSILLIAKRSAIKPGIYIYLLILFLVLPICAWVLKELLKNREQPAGAITRIGIFSTLVDSLLSAFETVLVYFANTLSFVRLAAYTLSHAALMLATFMVAGEVGSVPIIGNALSVLVIIFGNLIAILLEGIIAAVQALRLEYYEFFSKFFSGDGRPFKPFRLIKKEVS